MQSEPGIGDVNILRVLPNRFVIHVYSRKPLLVLLNHYSGKIHPLTAAGKILDPFANKEIPNLPILRGSIFLESKNIRKQAIKSISFIPEHGEFSRQEISEIKYSPQEKSLIFILSKNGKPIKVGQGSMQIKAKRIASVLRYLNQKNIKWRVIDARFSQKIVVSTIKAN